jgi:DDE family transposase
MLRLLRLISATSSPNRNQQFEYLTELRGRFQRRHLPIISVDTKKRELVGNFKNPGQRWECRPCRVFDHGFRTDSIGVAIPYGIYDLTKNRGSLSWAFPTTLPHSPHMPSPTGGTRKVLSDTPAQNWAGLYAIMSGIFSAFHRFDQKIIAEERLEKYTRA